MDPDSGTAVYGFELSNTNAEQLWLSIQRATDKAIEWRTTFFLTEESSELES